MIELIAVSTIVLIVGALAMGSIYNTKRFAIQEKAVARLRQLADAQERYRFSGDPSVNPDGSFGTYDELQLANLIDFDLVQDDVKAHTVNAFVPYYRIEITRSPNNTVDEPDENNYFIVALPIPTRWNLRTYYMLEDGEVWQTYGLKYFER